MMGYGGHSSEAERLANVPSIEILELSEEHIKFQLYNTNVAMANALRRIMIAEVPTLALDSVQIVENSTVLHDEFLAHRLGLIPLVSHDVDSYEYFLDCECEGSCPRCTIQFGLDVTNHNASTLHVTSGDLQLHSSSVGGDEPVPVDSRAEKNQQIMLVKLGQNQKLHLTGVARKGVGKQHAKWSPVAVATFQHDPIVQVDLSAVERLSESQRQEFTRSCPANVFAYDEHSRNVTVEDASKCMFCKECVKKADELDIEDLVTVASDPQRFTFTVETTGSRRPQDVVTSALKVLRKKLVEIEGHITTLQDQYVQPMHD